MAKTVIMDHPLIQQKTYKDQTSIKDKRPGLKGEHHYGWISYKSRRTVEDFRSVES